MDTTSNEKEFSIVDTTELDDDLLDAILPPRPSLPLSSQILPDHLTQTYALSNALVKTSLQSSQISNGVPTSRKRDRSTAFRVTIPPKFPPLPYSTSRTGLVYDERMRFHVDSDPCEDHPEQPRRILEIFTELNEAGLVARPGSTDPAAAYRLLPIPIRAASEEEILLVHSKSHLEFVQNLAGKSEDELRTLESQGYDSIYFNNNSWLCASLAAGGAIEAVNAVVAGSVPNAIAVIRPPGHHAEHNEPSGFCFFNNVCIAAKVAQGDFPETCRKVLILDWDVHHGNGVQWAFYDDPNVLYISLHVHRNGTFYPMKPYGNHTYCGKDNGEGKNINIPWLRTGMGDADYLYAFQQIVMPIAMEFDPDLVIISAGFDAAAGDELGECFVTPAGYSHMTYMLMQLAKGKVVACLEGGYNLRAIAKSALGVTKTLMGEPPERLGELQPSASAVSTVQTVIRTQAKYWKCMYPKDLDLRRKKMQRGMPLHDIIREWQGQKFFAEHRMSSLLILRSKVSPSFKDQILATPNYYEKRPLLLIFHDPPEAMGYPNPVTSQLELHNTWITDVSKSYLDWAVKNEFAVIDVNVPRHVTAEDDNRGYVDADDEQARAAMTVEVARYLWENYIEVSDSTHIFLLGIGDAYAGLVALLNTHPTAPESVTSTIAFVGTDNALRGAAGDDHRVRRYYRTSLIFVAHGHAAFDPDARKPRRKHGGVVRSDADSLQDMLLLHRAEVFRRLLDETEDWRRGNKVAAVMDDGDTGVSGRGVESSSLGPSDVVGPSGSPGFGGVLDRVLDGVTAKQDIVVLAEAKVPVPRASPPKIRIEAPSGAVTPVASTTAAKRGIRRSASPRKAT